ncbi:MAG: SurA N-terminal domain-containing protein [Treponema sp.]|nr:SurA N-terminal domain-containing protein [Treponema sp.]
MAAKKEKPETTKTAPKKQVRKSSGSYPDKQDDSTKADFIRRFKQNPFIFVGTIVILIIVIVAFVLVPAIVPQARRGVDLSFGSYNNVPISYVDGNYFYQVQQSLARQYQTNMDDSNYQITLYQIWREAFEQTVVQTAILDEMKNSGYIAPQDVVDRTVASLPDFQENGRFSSVKYRAMDNNKRMALWRQIRDSITTNMFYTDITGLKAPAGEGDFISNMATPQRSFDMVAFPISSYPDSEIASWVTANPSLFRITHFSKISVASEREARQILASVKAGSETFEDAAKNKSVDSYAENSGDMGSKMVFELLTEIPDEQIREQIISLPKGEISDVVKISDSSWAFFRAEETARPADTNDAVIMDRIRNYTMTYERGRAEDWLIGKANEFMASVVSNDFDSAVTQWALTKQTFGPLPLNYGDVSFFTSVSSSQVPELNGAGSNDTFWKACFNTPLKLPSNPIVLGDNVIVIYPTEEITADEQETSFIRMYYSYWLNQADDQDIRSYFLSNGKLSDKFWDTFSRLFLNNSNTIQQ